MTAQWSGPGKFLADEEDITSPHIVADKADLFMAYATVPGFRSDII